MDTGTTKMIAKKEGGIGWMIFNQPEKHNAVSYAMWQAVPRIMADFEADPEVRVIVLTGAGNQVEAQVQVAEARAAGFEDVISGRVGTLVELPLDNMEINVRPL